MRFPSLVGSVVLTAAPSMKRPDEACVLPNKMICMVVAVHMDEHVGGMVRRHPEKGRERKRRRRREGERKSTSKPSRQKI